MTREEAIIHLQSVQSMLLGADNKPISDLYYALDIAINSLKVDEAYDLMYENPNGWIPVTERLPEEDTKVYLACCDDGYVSAIMYSSGKWLIKDTNIIAWMPLPEAYKEERGE